jgi:hypothetical protein
MPAQSLFDSAARIESAEHFIKDVLHLQHPLWFIFLNYPVLLLIELFSEAVL